jgi:hypothetical protein
MTDASQVFGSGMQYFCDLLAIEMRNLEAVGLAQQKMLEGMGVLAQHQAEMVEGTLRRAFGAPPALPTSASGLPAVVIGQITSLKTTMQESQANSNVLSELAARSSGDVANILQSRMFAALDEFKAALEQAIPEKLPSPPVALAASSAAQA